MFTDKLVAKIPSTHDGVIKSIKYKNDEMCLVGHALIEIEVDDGKIKRTFVLNRPYYGLHIPPGIWAAEKGFSSGAICLVLASQVYDEDDYIREYLTFKLKKQA